MALIAVVLILIVWAILDIKEKLTPQNPPIEDIGGTSKNDSIVAKPESTAKIFEKFFRKLLTYFYKYAIMLSNK